MKVMHNDSEEQESGIINTYDTFRGIGFIRRKKGKDVFFFYDDIQSEQGVAVGDYVTFRIENKPKGPRAYDVKVM